MCIYVCVYTQRHRLHDLFRICAFLIGQFLLFSFPIKGKNLPCEQGRGDTNMFSQRWFPVIHLYGILKGQCNTACSLILWKYKALKFWCLIQGCNENITQIEPIILTVIVMRMENEINLMTLQVTFLFQNFWTFLLSILQRASIIYT